MSLSTNKYFALLAVLTASALFGVAGESQAQLINVDFGKDLTFGGTGVPTTPTYTGAAAIGSAGDFWNVTDTESNVFIADLFDAGNNSTGATLTWTDQLQSSTNAGAIEFGSTGHNDLMEDYAFTAPGETATVTIGGLAAGLDYELYLYGVPDNDGQETTFSVLGANEGAQAVTQGNIADDNGLANPDDFVLFTGNTGALGQIVYTQTGTGTASGFSGSNGFQLQIAVPEPASVAIWTLLGLGLAGFGYYRVRRNK